MENNMDMNSAESFLKRFDDALREEGSKLFARDAHTDTDPHKAETLRLLEHRRFLRERLHECPASELE
eukprot:384200-Pyramimonas_sp.AAC.1